MSNPLIKVSYRTINGDKMFYLIWADMVLNEIYQTKGLEPVFEVWDHKFGPAIKQHVIDDPKIDWDVPG